MLFLTGLDSWSLFWALVTSPGFIALVVLLFALSVVIGIAIDKLIDSKTQQPG
jgi:hypothetical protein